MDVTLFTFEVLAPVVALVFMLGLVIGSFLNVVVLRHQKREEVTGRSHCMHCGKTLTWRELVPLFSYLLQRGRCTNCKSKLSIQYPLVEFGTALLFVMVFYKVVAPYGFFVNMTLLSLVELVLHLTVWALFMVITVYDFRTKLIPDVFSFSLAGTAFLLLFVTDGGFAVPTVLSILAGPALFLPFYLLWSVSGGRWIGFGDGKLALGIGWYLGLSSGSTAVMLAFWIGAFVSVAIIVFQKLAQYTAKVTTGEQLTLKSEIPFGPFLVLGTLVVYVTAVDLFVNLL